MPDVGDIAGKQRPGLAPVGAVVVQHLAGGEIGTVAELALPPGRIVVHAIGRIGDHQVRLHAGEHPLDIRRRWCCRRRAAGACRGARHRRHG